MATWSVVLRPNRHPAPVHLALKMRARQGVKPLVLFRTPGSSQATRRRVPRTLRSLRPTPLLRHGVRLPAARMELPAPLDARPRQRAPDRWPDRPWPTVGARMSAKPATAVRPLRRLPPQAAQLRAERARSTVPADPLRVVRHRLASATMATARKVGPTRHSRARHRERAPAATPMPMRTPARRDAVRRQAPPAR